MPNPKPASPWLTCTLTCFAASLGTMFSGAIFLAADLPRMELSGVVNGEDLRSIRSSEFPEEPLLAMRVGAVATQQATVPAGPPRVQHAMPSMPKPGPCPLPILPALAAMEDTAFFTVRDVSHGKVEAISYTNHMGAQKRMHIYLPPGYSQGVASFPMPPRWGS